MRRFRVRARLQTSISSKRDSLLIPYLTATSKNEPDNSSLDTPIPNLESQISNLESQISNPKSRISNPKSRISNPKSLLSRLMSNSDNYLRSKQLLPSNHCCENARKMGLFVKLSIVKNARFCGAGTAKMAILLGFHDLLYSTIDEIGERI